MSTRVKQRLEKWKKYSRKLKNFFVLKFKITPIWLVNKGKPNTKKKIKSFGKVEVPGFSDE